MKRLLYLTRTAAHLALVLSIGAILPTLAQAQSLTADFLRLDDVSNLRRGQWAVKITFNQPVFPSAVRDHLKVRSEGKTEGYELRDAASNRPASDAADSFLIVPNLAAKNAPQVSITLSKGLADATGRRLLRKDERYKFQAIEKILVRDIHTFFKSEADKGLSIRLSRKISPNDLKNAISVTPQVSGLSVMDSGWRGFTVTGEFAYDKDYELTISPDKVNDGQAVLEERRFTFTGPGLAPRIEYSADRWVVELHSRQLLPLTLSNVTKVRCKLQSLPGYLIPEYWQALKSKGGLALWPQTERINAVREAAKAGRLNDLFGGPDIKASEVFFANDAKSKVKGYSLPLTFRPKPETGGAFRIELADPDGNFKGEVSKLIQISDLAISYKRARGKVLVWVTSINSGKPVEGVQILLADSKDLRFFAGKTDGKGLLLVKDGESFPAMTKGKESNGVSPQKVSIDKLAAVVAAKDADCSAVKLGTLTLQPFSLRKAEKSKSAATPVRGYFFTERGVYQPGETVSFKGVVRKYENGKITPPSGMEVDVQIMDPKSVVQYKKKLALNEFGTCNDVFLVKKFMPVGTYTISARFGTTDSDKTLVTRTFRVQEYKIPRQFVTLKLKREEVTTNDYVGLKEKAAFLRVTAHGQYYTGGPVKNARARWKATLVPITNQAPGYEGFVFGNGDDEERFLESGESVLDKSGDMRLSIPLDRKLMTGLYGIRVSVTVLDVDGEPATEVETYKPKPNFLVGVSRHPGQVQEGYSPTLSVVVVNQAGERVRDGEIRASLMKKDYFYTRKRDDSGRIRYMWEEGWLKTLGSRVPIKDGSARFDLQLPQNGEYLVSFTYEDKSKAYSSQTRFKVGWEDYYSWRRSKEQAQITANEVLVGLTKQEYSVGDTVRADFSLQRPVRKCLVTIERGDIFSYEIVDVNGDKGAYSFKAKPDHRPNVYLSVLAPTGRGDFPVYTSQTDEDIPGVFFGYADIRIRSDKSGLQLAIAPDIPELKAKPGAKTSLSFRVTDDKGKGVLSEMAVCVVDEGVLALTRFKTPDQSSLTDFDIPLSVVSGDLRLALVSQDLFRIFKTNPLTGGGMGAGLVSPSLRKRFDPVAYFNPTVRTDSNGDASVEFELPDTTTTYRVYAVVCDKGSGFVSGKRSMLVTKDFFIEPSVPRFLIPGDKTKFPVTLHSKIDSDGQVKLEVKGSPDLKATLDKTGEKLAPQSTSVIYSDVEALGGADNATLQFFGNLTTQSDRFEDAIQKSFPVHSRYLPVNRVSVGHFVGKTQFTVPLPEILSKLDPKDLSREDLSVRLSLGITNWTRVAPGFKYLLRYPYGCVEQTSSGIIPLAGLRKVVQAGLVPNVTTGKVDEFLKAGITRLLSMQVSNGGFGYWPGQSDVSWWGSLYALSALTLSKRAGYEIPENNMNNALKFVRHRLVEDRAQFLKTRWRPWTEEMGVYLLAENDRISKGELSPFFEQYEKKDDLRKALLLMAAKRKGLFSEEALKRKVSALKPKFNSALVNYDNSSVRAIAICLLAAVDIGVKGKAPDTWAGALIERIRPQGGWYSTADTGWALLALGRYYEGKGATRSKEVKCKIRYSDAEPVEATLSDIDVELPLDPRKLLGNGSISIEADKRDLVNYALHVTYPDVGTDPASMEHGFSLKKTIENLNGDKEIRVGDVVRITLMLTVPSETALGKISYAEYLALVDPLPAGLVAVNAELATEGALKPDENDNERSAWRDGYYEFTPSHLEMRNDQVRVFRDRAWPGPYRFSYLARAALQGEYWMRGSRISLMYDPDVYGKTKGRIITVLPAKK